MSMHLTVDHLKQIVEALIKLEASGLSVTSLNVAGHNLLVERVTDQNEQNSKSTYFIRGITTGALRQGNVRSSTERSGGLGTVL